MMLCLVGVLLSCGALCIATPVPPAAGAGCAVSSLIQETLRDVRDLKSKDSSKITLLNTAMEADGNLTTYLEGFIEALKSSEEKSEKILRIAQKLQKIRDALKSCFEPMENVWEPNEHWDFSGNLEYLLRFLNQNTLPE